MRSTLRISFILLLPVFFLVNSSALNAQVSANSHFPEENTLCLHAGLSLRNGMGVNAPFLGYGLRVECPLSRHWYVNYNYSFTQTFSGIKLSHIPFTAMLAPVACQIRGKNTGSATLALLLIAFSVPEGFSYDINPSGRIQFVPFINPFSLGRCIYLKEGTSFVSSWTYTINAGLECESDFLSRYYFGADIESTWFPDNGRVIPELTMTVGMKFAGINYGDMKDARDDIEDGLNK